MRTQRPGESALLLLDAVDVIALPTHELRDLDGKFRQHGLQTELRFGDPDYPIAAVLALSDVHDNRVDLLVGLRGP